MKKLNVNAPPRRTIPPPYRPAARENWFCFCTPGLILVPVQTKEKKQAKSKQTKKNAHFLSTTNLHFLFEFLFIDFEWFSRSFNIIPIFDTEFSPCVRFFDGKRAARSSQASFQKNDSPLRETSLFVVKCSFPRGRITFFENLLGSISQPVFHRKIQRRVRIQYRR